MADKNINELEPVIGITGNELMEVLQGGINKRAILSEVTDALRITSTTDLEDMPTATQIANGMAGDMLVLNDDLSAYILKASKIISGFYDKSAVAITYDYVNDILTLNGTFTFITAAGNRYTKSNDSFVLSPVNGVIYIYYDDTGTLQQLNNPTRDELYNSMLITLPVVILSYNTTYSTAVFVGNFLKGRNPIGLWVKNFFDVRLYILSGIYITDVTYGDGDDDADARFGLSAGKLLFVDNKFNVPEHEATGTWTVGYFTPTGVAGVPDNPFPVLTDIDLGVDTTGRIVYNNDGYPLPADSGNRIWYFVAVNCNIEEDDRCYMIMGNGQYGTIALAEAAMADEIATIEANISVSQGFRIVKALLYRTRNTYTNTVKGLIEQAVDVVSEDYAGTPSVSIPDDLINGSDASDLHNHDSLYLFYDWGFAISDETSDLTLDNYAEREIIRPCILDNIVFYVNIAPTGSPIICEVYKNDTLIETITLPVSSDSITVPNTTQFDVGDRIKAYITQIGATIPGAGAKIEPKATIL